MKHQISWFGSLLRAERIARQKRRCWLIVLVNDRNWNGKYWDFFAGIFCIFVSWEKCHHLVGTKYKGFFCFKDTHFSYVSHFFRSFCPEHGEQTVFCVLCSTEDSALNRKPTFHVCEHHQLCSTATVTLWRVVCVSAVYACGSVKTHTNTCIGQNTRIAHTKRLRAREPTTTKTTNDAWRTTQNWWRV